jgi:hypothetical protein
MSTTPTILRPWAGNLYAPSWAAVTPQLPGCCDVDYDFDPLNVTLGAGQFSYKNPINVDDDADYLAREIFVGPIAGSQLGTDGQISPQDLKVRITDGDGNYITSDWITANDLCGPVGAAILPLRKATTLFIDFWNQGDGALNIQFGFKGFKRFPCNADQGPIPKYWPMRARYCKEWAGARFEEWEYVYEFVNGFSAFSPPWAQNLQPTSPNQIFQKLPLPTEKDADFLWRGLSGAIMSHGGPVVIPQQMWLTFYDHNTIPMANAVPRPGSVPALPGPGAELVLSNGGGRMNPVFPEILVPRGATLAVDIAIACATSVQFSLRGLKVYTGAGCDS